MCLKQIETKKNILYHCILFLNNRDFEFVYYLLITNILLSGESKKQVWFGSKPIVIILQAKIKYKATKRNYRKKEKIEDP